MFPNSFRARVAERFIIWGALIGFLLLLLGAVEVIYASRMDEILLDRRQATASLLSHVETQSPGTVVDVTRSEFGKAIAKRIRSIDQRQASLRDSNEQNELLIGLLALFVIAMILFLEYRWLVKPVVRIAAVLRTEDDGAWRELTAYAPRRDEIGAFAQALIHHFQLVQSQQQLASQQQQGLSERLARQDNFRRESVSFQARIAEIVQQLEGHAGRMSTASGNLLTISSEADARAAASAQSTQRVSGHVDVVASSIRDIAATLTEVVGEAERTSQVAASARSLVAAAKNDVAALTDAARTIEPVIGLIEDVANQTNLLALNATIEAARAGEMGRGFGVVAHEVKQLATRTARATEEVRSGLHGISAASTRIVERVAKLVDSIEQVDAVAAAIADSMRRQDSTSQTITSNTGRAASDVREVAAAVKDVAAIITDAKQAADLVTKASADLGQQAADLKSAVVRFIETTERIAA
jgi:methyl-accepting chemotaxis protein